MLVDKVKPLQTLEKAGIAKVQVTTEIDYGRLTTRSKNAIIRALRAGVRPRSGITATVVGVLAERYQLPITMISGDRRGGYMRIMRDIAARNPNGVRDYLEFQIATARLMGKGEDHYVVHDLRRHVKYIADGSFPHLGWCWLANTDPQVFYNMVVKDALLKHEAECIEELVRDVQTGAKIQVSLNSAR